jgi:hypothetical protein
MAAVVSLRAVADEMDFLLNEMHAYLNRQTGELYSTTTELLEKAEEGDDEDLLGWEVEIIAKLREVLNSPDWLMLPTRGTHDDYRIMERFCRERTEGDLQDELLRAIDGRGAFRWFRDVVHRRGIKEAWYAFRREALAEEAADWLEAEGIAYKP